MNKLTEIWFKAEDLAVQFSQTKFTDISVKVLKTISLFIICVIAICYLLIQEGISLIFKEKKHIPTPPKNDLSKDGPLRSIMSEKYGEIEEYNEHGFPKNLKRTDGPMSEKEYTELRKVL